MSQPTEINLGVTADLHVHLRDGEMMELITPTVREGGVSIAYVMPNLVPPITKIDQVIRYKKNLELLAPKTTFLMTFYLSRDLTPELVEKAAILKVIKGIKCYPAGVTTNSSAGVDPNDFSDFYPIFKIMEKYNLILNLHGEKPSTNHDDIHHNNSHDDNEHIHILNAEESFLPALFKLHQDFPNLKIVLEHCTTKAAINAIEKINSKNVAATITAHHLYLTIDNWSGNPVNFCKPVAKLPSDKSALINAAISGKPFFFFGSDSAPHPLSKKSTHVNVCAGVYTQNNAISYLAEIFQNFDALDKLKNFVNDFGKNFYNINDSDEIIKSKDTVILYQEKNQVPQLIKNDLIGDESLVVAPFKAGEELNWNVKWRAS
ncbi:dihydroorotase [Ascoidea rubescens DSM 1968]|uniref:Dihydroorotase n=1 Tax=Ascoidea rubescens DSM 1968 TaxID=1344418 RepID=A0A1D2VDX8_9ASCO|nr:Dihydroorotase [Ascoidea rubescens DSM 1968]ODV59851.1 Dihydroorotase [Ascoidea rubescens DSM 1968]